MKLHKYFNNDDEITIEKPPEGMLLIIYEGKVLTCTGSMSVSVPLVRFGEECGKTVHRRDFILEGTIYGEKRINDIDRIHGDCL
jgi:hypothetical protein